MELVEYNVRSAAAGDGKARRAAAAAGVRAIAPLAAGLAPLALTVGATAAPMADRGRAAPGGTRVRGGDEAPPHRTPAGPAGSLLHGRRRHPVAGVARADRHRLRLRRPPVAPRVRRPHAAGDPHARAAG